MDVVSQRGGSVIRDYAKRLKGRVDTLLAEAKLKLDEETLAREVAVLSDRSWQMTANRFGAPKRKGRLRSVPPMPTTSTRAGNCCNRSISRTPTDAVCMPSA